MGLTFLCQNSEGRRKVRSSIYLLPRPLMGFLSHVFWSYRRGDSRKTWELGCYLLQEALPDCSYIIPSLLILPELWEFYSISCIMYHMFVSPLSTMKQFH